MFQIVDEILHLLIEIHPGEILLCSAIFIVCCLAMFGLVSVLWPGWNTDCNMYPHVFLTTLCLCNCLNSHAWLLQFSCVVVKSLLAVDTVILRGHFGLVLTSSQIDGWDWLINFWHFPRHCWEYFNIRFFVFSSRKIVIGHWIFKIPKTYIYIGFHDFPKTQWW